jgi:hypothetical protein
MADFLARSGIDFIGELVSTVPAHGRSGGQIGGKEVRSDGEGGEADFPHVHQ